ncbi:MAG: polysaccharide deacetylase family protein, partial [Fimbriimonadaceae bacterium]|nr:polysaccharide deacetylase family protein [Alphaproteobacteria bacterium]
AYPILKRLDVPMAVYVTTSYADRNGILWWLALEEVIRKCEYVGIEMEDEDRHFVCGSPAEKRDTFAKIYWWLRKLPQARQREIVRDLAYRYQIDLKAQCQDLVMSWDEIMAFAADPLVTIGAHTVNHFALSCLPEKDARAEMINSAKIISSYIGEFPRHFSYPYGDPGSAGPREFDIAKDLGFLTAVTTRKGVLFEDHGDFLTALPRISLNGDYQSLRYLDLFLSGAPFALKNRMRKLDVA